LMFSAINRDSHDTHQKRYVVLAIRIDIVTSR
jgi:hypothetical protein